MDMLYNGNPKEKINISFMMCDIQGEGKVFQKDYHTFCIQFLAMYEELTQQKTRIENLENEIASDFERIVSISGEQAKTNSDGDKYFDITDFQAALEKYPEIFSWIENPENYFNEMTKTNKKKKELMTISLVEFENYHREVMEAFDTILNAVHSRFGEKFSTDEHAAFRQKTRRLNSTLKT